MEACAKTDLGYWPMLEDGCSQLSRCAEFIDCTSGSTMRGYDVVCVYGESGPAEAADESDEIRLWVR